MSAFNFTSHDIKNAINNLSGEFKDCFSLYMEGYTHKEIAKTLNMDIAITKSYIALARQELIDSLKGVRLAA